MERLQIKHRNEIYSDKFELKHKNCLLKLKLKQICKVRQVVQSTNFAPARQLKVCWWIALLSLWEHSGMNRWQKNETCKDIIRLKHEQAGEKAIIC